MAGKDENGLKGFQFRKPLNRTKWETFRKAIYDSSTGQFLGRTGKSWGQLLLFYTLFYIVLAAMWAICMQGLLATLDDKAPKWQLDESLIGSNPGLGFRPISDNTDEGSLIWYTVSNKTTGQKWVDLLDKFLKPYREEQTGSSFEACHFNKTASKGHVCTVDLEKYGPCSPSNNYGYFSSSPCVFLKLNKIFGWKPKYYTEPIKDMPDDLQEDIVNGTSADKQLVWISCKGARDVDKEHLTSFNYYPFRGFPAFYFPYTNEPNYLSPLIAVQIEKPKPNVIISIECRAWAKNIEYEPSDLDRKGSVKFEILQD